MPIKHNQKAVSRFSLLLFTLLQLIALPAQGATYSTLRGAGLEGTATFNGINVSMVGGGDILVAGSGLNYSPPLNKALLATSDLGSYVQRQGSDLTEDDQFLSAPSTGKLSYSNPSIADLFNLDIVDFERYDRVDFTLSFLDSETGDQIQCADQSKCLVRYSWNYTPLLRYMSPPVMYPGMIATAAVDAKQTMNYKRADRHAAEIRIDGELLDYDGYLSIDAGLGSNSRVSGIQGSRQRNNDLHPQIKFSGAGYAREWHLESAVCGPEATSYDDCYTAKVLPTIQSLSATGGSAEGGQALRITGTSLDASSTVRILVDGVRCIVADGAISESEITCTTQYKDLAGNSCSDPSSPICDCADPLDVSTCSVSSVCEDQSNPVCTCFESDSGKTCEFAAACSDPADNSCQCTDINDPATCWFQPVCNDAANPACVCTDPYDDATCDFHPSCRADNQDYCVCDNLWNITTCKVQNCDDPDNFACECTCDDPTDSTTCYDCQYKAACTDSDHDDECFCHDLYDFSTCSAVANCTDPDLGVCTLCSDPSDITTCQQSPVCIDPVNQACTCTDVTNATSCMFNAACLDADDDSCVCSDPADLNTCYMQPSCDDPNSQFCECTTSTSTVTSVDPVTNLDVTETVTTVDCQFKAECLDKMDLTCTCDDYADLGTCSINDLTPAVVPECKDLNNEACRCYEPGNVDSCEYALSCLDPDDDYCRCLDITDPSTCNINRSRYIVGQQGLVRTAWVPADGVNIWNYPSHMSLGSASVWTTLEIAHATYTNSVEAFQGYFRAPMTGRYRFLMSCDDNCALWFNKNKDSMNPARSTHDRLLYRASHTSFRNHYPELRNEASRNFGVQFSKWVDLQEGQYHHMHVAVGQGGGDYHLSVGVELKPAVMPAVHPRKEKQIQRVGVSQSIEYWEVTLIRVTGGDLAQDLYKITMVAPDVNATVVYSEELTLNATATEMRDAIQGFYKEYYSVTPHVEKYFEDVNGTLVSGEDFVLAEHFVVYNVTVRSPLGPPGTCTQANGTMATIGWTAANITFIESCGEEAGAQLVDPILEGSMYFTCYDTAGQSWSTAQSPIGVCSSARAVENHIISECPFLDNKMSVSQVWRDIRYGCEYQLNFWNMDAPVNQFVLHSYGDQNYPDQLDPIIGKNLAFKAEERRPFGSVLIWEQIPAEWFYTSHSVPQVKMWVDEYPVLCATGNCDYVYSAMNPVITSYTLNGKTLTIGGVDLPATDISVQMGYVACDIDDVANPATATQIVCELRDTVPAGKWLPQVIDQSGIVRYDSGVQATEITASVTSFTPTTIQAGGGTTVTVEGTNFPPFYHPRYAHFKIYLGASADASVLNEECSILSYSSTQVTCRSAPAVRARRRNLGRQLLTSSGENNLALLIPSFEPSGEGSVIDGIDGPTVGDEQTWIPSGEGRLIIPGGGGETIVQPNQHALSSVSEPVQSPMGLGTVELCIAPAWAGMCANDPPFEVSLVPVQLDISHLNQHNNPRPLNVVGCDETTGCILVKYGGAYSGTYTWDIESTDPAHGTVDTTGEEFRALVEVTEVIPSESSVLGGAELTLRGGVFQEAIEDNIVKVGAQWWSGIDHYCYMTEVISASEIRCRLPLDRNREANNPYDVIYFLSTFEEGNQNCGASGGEVCLHTFIPVAEMPQVATTAPNLPRIEFNAATEQLEMVFEGTGFMGANGASAPEEMDIFVGGVKQDVLSLTDSEIRVGLDQLPGGEGNAAVDLFFPKGIPGGLEAYESGIEIAPAFAGLSHNKEQNGVLGSVAGSEIEAHVPGVGIGDEGRYTLVAADGTEICDSVTIEEYGKLKCNVTAGLEFPSGTELSLKNTDTNAEIACSAAVSTDCDYQTAAAGVEPTISGITISADGTEMTFAGANFPTSGFTCDGNYGGSTATGCQINSAGEAVLTFADGAPTFEAPGVAPLLRFIPDDESIAINASGSSETANPLVINSVNGGSNLETSFAGGQILNVQANGLAEKVATGEAVVRVCGQECIPNADQSDAANFACAVPAIATTQSNSLFQITEEETLRATPSGTPIENARQVIGGSGGAQLLDGSPLPGLSGTSAGCTYGLKFADGLVGELNEFGLFLDYFDTTKIHDNLIFQGSNDNFATTPVALVTVSSEAHEGWNYYDLVELLGAAPKYNAYRIYSAVSRGCDDIGEIALIGREVIDDPADTHACDIEIIHTVDGAEVVAPLPNGEQVVYRTDMTPVVDTISNRYLDVEGGETITLTGSGFSGGGAAEITIDGAPCLNPTVVSDTEMTCTTGARIGDGNCAMDRSALDIFFTDKGKAVALVTLKYVSLWSKSSTWGDLFLPIDGESISVPKCRHLLMDIDESPEIYAIIVDGGSLIIPPSTDPTHERKLHAHYIMINNGLMEVGTEENPYCSKLIITMYGFKYDPAMPIYGKKVIGVRYSTLDMHGCPVHPCWTQLDATATAGTNQITTAVATDWKVGDVILLPSTSYSMGDAELHTIASITSDADHSYITTVDDLRATHYGEIEEYGTGEFIDLRGEISLMSRSIIYRGDPETSVANKFGAHIMVHSPGDETSIGRISNVQFEDVGQAFLLGKYPIHFHMIGRVTKSYVKCNTVNRSYNRGTTIHGVQYLTVKDNTYFETMGHTLFIEDAAETKNLIEHNLVVNTRASHSLLDTDTTPACYWITHPDNIFRDNHAAGCAKYGFWFDLQTHSTGPSASTNICPTRSKLGEFTGNVAHTVGRYGLRIFHDHIPRENPCTGGAEVPAVYEDFTGYMNNRSGIMGLRLGAVVFKDIKVADNKNSGIQFDHVVTPDPEANYLEDALVIGSSRNPAGGRTGHGIISPQTEGWQVKNAHFFSFQDHGAALGQCSHCFEVNMEDTDADTVRFSGLQFDDATVPRRIGWTTYRKGIFHDLDGSLTGLGPDTWATPLWEHNQWNETTGDMACTYDDAYDGLICDDTVTVRKILFYAPSGGSIEGRELKLWQWDDSFIDSLTDDELYLYYSTNENATDVAYEPKKNPEKHWTLPFVIPKGGKHTFYARWGYGHDFEGVKLAKTGSLWTEEDGEVEFIMPFYAIREAIYFDDNLGDRHANLTWFNTAHKMCDNVVYNETFEDNDDIGNQPKNFSVRVNHFDPAISECTITGIQCLNNCWDQIGDVEDLGGFDPDAPRLWSNTSTWPSGVLPVDGDDVVIDTNMNVIMDIYETPKLSSLEVNGKLSCKQGQPCHIQAYNFWVRRGELEIGTAAEPFNSSANITLLGNNTQEYWAFTPQIDSGNKNLVVTGKASLHGLPRDLRSVLLVTAGENANEIQVEPGLDWTAGDYIGILTSNAQAFASESHYIAAYDSATGIVTLEEPLENPHFGARQSTADDFDGLDFRSEVVLFTRNVKIQASLDDISYALQDAWGCRVLVADFFERDWSHQKGHLELDYVEIYNCSQRQTEKPALSFEYARAGESSVTNSAIHHGQGAGVHVIDSRQVTLSNNIVYHFFEKGLKVEKSFFVTIDNNRIGHIGHSWDDQFTYFVWEGFKGGAVALSGSDLVVRDNVAFGANYYGFEYNALKCDDRLTPTTVFENNVAHSIAGYGFIALPSGRGGECTEVSYLKGYKNKLATVVATNNELRCHDLVTAGSGFGIACMGQGGGDVKVYDSVIYGDKGDPNEDFGNCFDSIGILMSTFGGHASGAPKVAKWPKMLAGGGSHGTSLYKDILFKGLDGETKCGKKQTAIVTNFLHSDYHPIGQFEFMEFRDTREENIIHMSSPSPGWANPDDCGPFTCTGLYNTIAKFERTSYTGSPNALGLPTRFQVIPDNKESVSSQVIPRCEDKRAVWNGYICENQNLGVLLVDSRDPDRMTRNQQPLYIQDSPLGTDPVYNNRLNAYMDHCWDGMYTCQTREQKFPSLVDQDRDYRIEYTGTPAKKQTVELFGDYGSLPFMVTIWYPDAGAYAIYDRNQELVPPNDWDYALETWGEIQGNKGCGENRYEGVKNRLQFWITPGCKLFIQDRESVMLAVRLEFTLGEFFEDGGIGTFTNRMAAVLGIQAADLRVVQAYEGSVVVVFQVFDPSDDPAVLGTIKEAFVAAMPTVGNLFGGPVMSYDDGQVTVYMPGYEETGDDSDGIEQWFDAVSPTEDKEPKVKEVIEVKRIYVGADEIEHAHLGLNVIVLGIAVLVAVVLVCLVYVLYRTFTKERRTHEAITSNVGAFKKNLDQLEDSELYASQATIKPQSQYMPGKTDEFFYKKQRQSLADSETDMKNRTATSGFPSQSALESIYHPEHEPTERQLTEKEEVIQNENAKSEGTPGQPEQTPDLAEQKPGHLSVTAGVADATEASTQLSKITSPASKKSKMPSPGRSSVSAQQQRRSSSPYMQKQKVAAPAKGEEKGQSKKHDAHQ